MSRMNKKQKEELVFFLNDKGRIAHNAICRRCTSACKQSFRAALVRCPKYGSKRRIRRQG